MISSIIVARPGKVFGRLLWLVLDERSAVSPTNKNLDPLWYGETNTSGSHKPVRTAIDGVGLQMARLLNRFLRSRGSPRNTTGFWSRLTRIVSSTARTSSKCLGKVGGGSIYSHDSGLSVVEGLWGSKGGRLRGIACGIVKRWSCGGRFLCSTGFH